jgi:hypothetical protein
MIVKQLATTLQYLILVFSSVKSLPRNTLYVELALNALPNGIYNRRQCQTRNRYANIYCVCTKTSYFMRLAILEAEEVDREKGCNERQAHSLRNCPFMA